MSFGFSPTDVLALIKQCKHTYDSCRHAPEDFKEVGRGAKGLHFVFETLHVEVKNPGSLLNRDEHHKAHIGEIADNCKAVLSKLDSIVLKHSSLGTLKIKAWDRFTFPRKEILDIQGKLQYHQNNLIAYLHMIGVSAIGRVEQKFDVPGKLHEEIMENQERIFGAIDRLAAEVRRGLHTEPVFSSHTIDDDGVWKAFHEKLLQQGFSRQCIQPHEKESRKRVKELVDLRLCDSDASNDTSDDAGFETETAPAYQPKTTFQSAYAVTDESGCESEATLPPRPSKIELRRQASSSTIRSKKRDSAISLEQPSPSSSRRSLRLDTEDISKPALTNQKRANLNLNTSPSLSPYSTHSPMRIWTGKDSRLKLKAAFIHKENNYIHLQEVDGGETIVLVSNLSQRDLDYLDTLDIDRIKTIPKPTSRNSNFTAAPSNDKSKQQPKPETKNTVPKPEQAIDVVEIPLIRTDKPETLVGKRTHWRSPWKYRRLKAIPRRKIGYNSLELPAAAARGDYRECERLLGKGHDIESDKEESTTTDSEGNTTTTIIHTTTGLYRSATRGFFDVAQLFLERGANVETYNGDKSVLFVTVEMGKVKMSRLLLEYGASPSTTAGLLRRTPLHLAAQSGNVFMTELLLEFDATIDARDKSRETPLYLAAMEGRKNAAKALLRQGADTSLMSGDTQTPLYKAAGRGHEKTVRVLLTYGADPNHGRGIGGETSLFKASKKGYAEIVHDLLRYGADPNLANDEKSTRTGSTADSLIWLLKPDQDPRNVFGLCSLYGAAEAGNEEIVKMLADHGAELDFKRGRNGETAMYAAARRKHKSIAEMLFKRGAQIKPQEMVDDVMRIMNPAEEETELEVREEKSNRIEVISSLMGRLTKQRVQRGVNSWTKTELGTGMDFVTESMISLAESQMKKLGGYEGGLGDGLGGLLRDGR